MQNIQILLSTSVLYCMSIYSGSCPKALKGISYDILTNFFHVEQMFTFYIVVSDVKIMYSHIIQNLILLDLINLTIQ